MEVSVAGYPLALSDIDCVNALIVHNNILNGQQGKVAIFRPEGSLSEVFMLIMAGLAYYKEAAIRNDKLSEHDFTPGILVSYKGEIYRYAGTEIEGDGSTRYVLANEDEYKTRSFLTRKQFLTVAKYSGSRTTPDKPDSKTKLPAIEGAVHQLIGYEGQQVKLSDYHSMLVCPGKPELVEILKETTVNGHPFFSMFPSAKYTPGGLQRIGRDHKERSYVFYFASTLSSVDDLLRTLPQGAVNALFTDADRAGRSASLLSSMLGGSIEDVYVLGNAAHPDTVGKMRGLGFAIWAWKHGDFVEAYKRNPVVEAVNIPDRRPAYVRDHNNLTGHMATKTSTITEVPYPGNFAKAEHAALMQLLAQMNRLVRDSKNSLLGDFLRSAHGLVNKLFQLPVPADAEGGLDAYWDNFAIKAVVLEGQLNMAVNAALKRFMELAQKAKTALGNDAAKYNLVAKGIKHGSACVIVKRAKHVGELERMLAGNSQATGHEITTDPGRADPQCIKIVWTFRPNLDQYANGYAVPIDSVYILFPHQIDEMQAVEQQYDRFLSPYAQPADRAAILKIDPSLLDSGVQESVGAPPANEILEGITLEETLFMPDAFGRTQHADERAGMENTSAKLVAFSGGFIAYFESEHSVKVINTDGDAASLDDKKAEDLEPGDKVVFVKQERDTIFDELVEYYGHKPEVVRMVKLAEAWRNALREYSEKNNLDIPGLRHALAAAGLERTELTVKNWMGGKVICPPEDDYRPVDIIASLTGDEFLNKEKEEVKAAAHKVHSMRIKIGHYLARRILQSTVTQERFDDPVLEQKLNTASSYAEVAEVAAIGGEYNVGLAFVNRLLGAEDF